VVLRVLSGELIRLKDTKAREGNPLWECLSYFHDLGLPQLVISGNNEFMNSAVALSRFQFEHTAQDISHAVITAAMKVHSELGAGLLERAYTTCLQFELRRAGYNSIAQLGLPVVYSGVKLDVGYRIDLLVENLVVVEIKSVDAISPVHYAQIIIYLKLSGKSIGLLINFNVVHF